MLFKGGLVNLQDLGEVLDVLGRSLGLAIEKGGYSDFLTAEGLGNGLEREVLLLLGLEEDWRGGRKARGDGGLRWSMDCLGKRRQTMHLHRG